MARWGYIIDMFSHKTTRVAALMALFVLAYSTLQQHRAVAGMYPLQEVLQGTVRDLNHEGRVPLHGVAGGMLNNLWQTATGHASTLGCGGQATALYTRLQKVQGWRFQLRYEYGVNSPILLPHQWVTGFGPNGEVVQLDPWAAEIYQN